MRETAAYVGKMAGELAKMADEAGPHFWRICSSLPS